MEVYPRIAAGMCTGSQPAVSDTLRAYTEFRLVDVPQFRSRRQVVRDCQCFKQIKTELETEIMMPSFQRVPLLLSTEVHGVTSRKPSVPILTTMRTSDLMNWNVIFFLLAIRNLRFFELICWLWSPLPASGWRCLCHTVCVCALLVLLKVKVKLSP
jgi:hypothetical protein